MDVLLISIARPPQKVTLPSQGQAPSPSEPEPEVLVHHLICPSTSTITPASSRFYPALFLTLDAIPSFPCSVTHMILGFRALHLLIPTAVLDPKISTLLSTGTSQASAPEPRHGSNALRACC